MDIRKIKSIKMSLMTSKGEINESTGKTDYLVKGSAKFNITDEIISMLNEQANLLEQISQGMFHELLNKIDEVDSVGIWIDYDGEVIDNSIKLDTLDDMKNYGADDLIPIYEFVKLTLDLIKVENNE